MNRKVPNLFIVGAMKAGTTSLHNYLGQHPHVFFPEKKEPHFFLYKDGEQTLNYNGPGDDRIESKMMINNAEQYFALFSNSRPIHKYVGEASAMYLYDQEAPRRIKKECPDAKIIILLRNPVTRAYSAYSHLRRDYREPTNSFTEACKKEIERIENNYMPIWHYKEASMYYKQVKQYLDYFGGKNVQILIYEDFISDVKKVLLDVYDFLGLDRSSNITEFHLNKSGKPKSKILHLFLKQDNVFKKLFKPIIPFRFRKRISSFLFNKNLQSNDKLSKEEFDKYLKIFEKDIELLQSITNKDLSKWLIINNNEKK